VKRKNQKVKRQKGEKKRHGHFFKARVPAQPRGQPRLTIKNGGQNGVLKGKLNTKTREYF